MRASKHKSFSFSALLLLAGLSLSGCVSFPEGLHAPVEPTVIQSSAAKSGIIRVADLNMLHGFLDLAGLKERWHLIMAELKRLNPDVLLLQEVPVHARLDPQLAPWLARELGYSFVYARANGKAALIGFEEGEAVFSRFPILAWESHQLRPIPGIFERRIVLRVVLQTELGRLEVYNLHLSHKVEREALRVRQVRDLIEYVKASYRFKELPAIIGGDFNATLDSQPYRILVSSGFVDAALEADPPAAANTSGIEDIRDGNAVPTERIDYLFLYQGGSARRLGVASAPATFWIDRRRPPPACCGPAIMWACFATWRRPRRPRVRNVGYMAPNCRRGVKNGS